MRRHFGWQIFVGCMALVLLSIAGSQWYADHCWRRLVLDHVAESLRSHAAILEPMIRKQIAEATSAELRHWFEAAAGHSNIRLTVVLPSGTVVADTHQDAGLMDNHLHRPEVQSALSGKPLLFTRKSFTVSETMMYWALPVRTETGIVAVIRTSVPIASIDSVMNDILMKTGWGALVVAVGVGLMSFFLSRRFSRPLEEIAKIARLHASGHTQVRLNRPDVEELREVADAFNAMADRFSERLREINIQHAEQEAILSAMSEGVVAVDHRNRLITINQAAVELLDIDHPPKPDVPIETLTRNSAVLNILAEVFKERRSIEREVALQLPQQRIIHLRAAPLIDKEGQSFGVLLVMTNLTRLKRLETIRKDFVSNVSHELKTPITSIKGFVETLLSGAIDEPDTARHFLQILARQADRLNRIVEDLLSLSRIEQEMDRQTIEKTDTAIADIVELAVQSCATKASEKAMTIEVDCPGDLRAKINPQLMEEAVVNLLMNAIQYSNPQSKVRIRAAQGPKGIRIDVTDTGCGIPAEHLPRIFERFYRVDPGRSRKDGGTGLGLAIVRNILSAHGGTVSVTSEPGKGSTFSLFIPNTSG